MEDITSDKKKKWFHNLHIKSVICQTQRNVKLTSLRKKNIQGCKQYSNGPFYHGVKFGTNASLSCVFKVHARVMTSFYWELVHYGPSTKNGHGSILVPRKVNLLFGSMYTVTRIDRFVRSWSGMTPIKTAK